MLKLLLFMPTLNQKPEKLLAKVEDIQLLRHGLLERDRGLRIFVSCDGSQQEFKTPETLRLIKEDIGDIFDFMCYEKNVGKTVAVVDGLQHLLLNAGVGDLIGCLDDNEHSFISALDLIELIEEGYLGAIGTINYPRDILNVIDRHAMPAVGAIESMIMDLRGTLCIYASGYWIQHVEIVRIALKVYGLYRKLFRILFPNEIIKLPKWGTPTLLQELMTWTIRTQRPWVDTPNEFRRMAVSYLPCKEIPALTPLGRGLDKVLAQLRALVLNGLVLDQLLGKNRTKQFKIPA